MRKENYFVISLVRVMACFLIVRGHYHDVFGLHNTILKGVILGAGPVAIFFVISGYLAYLGFCKNPENGRVKKYYIKRASRIIPSYYTVLLLCMIVDYFWGIVSNKTIGFGWIRYFTFTNMIIPSKSFWIFNDVFGFWTMGCFPFFYLMVPFLAKCLDRKNGIYELLFGGIMLNILTKQIILKCLIMFEIDEIESFSNLNPLSTLYLFIFGMCISSGKVNNSEKRVLASLAIVFLLMLIFEKNGYVLWGLASSFLCLSSDFFQINKKYFSNFWYRIIMFLDSISFHVYLTHLLVANIVLKLFGISGISGGVVSTVISIIFSAGIHQAIYRVPRIVKN